MPREIARAVEQANDDDDVHVIVLTGAGRAFCAGYDLKDFAETPARNQGAGTAAGDPRPWDPMVDFNMMHANTRDFMSLWLP